MWLRRSRRCFDGFHWLQIHLVLFGNCSIDSWLALGFWNLIDYVVTDGAQVWFYLPSIVGTLQLWLVNSNVKIAVRCKDWPATLNPALAHRWAHWLKLRELIRRKQARCPRGASAAAASACRRVILSMTFKCLKLLLRDCLNYQNDSTDGPSGSSRIGIYSCILIHHTIDRTQNLKIQ